MIRTLKITGYVIVLIGSCRGDVIFEPVYGIPDVRIRRVAVAQNDRSFIAAASDNALYISRDRGEHFENRIILKDEQVQHLCISRDKPAAVYLAASRHCYRVGESAERIFSGNEDELIHFIAELKGRIYLGTSSGLYHADPDLLDWHPEPGLRNRAVYSIDGFGDDIYLACSDGAYLLRKDGTMRQLFVLLDGSETAVLPFIRVDRLTPSRLWLSTTKGLFSSNNWGETWNRYFITGTDGLSIRTLAQAPLNSRHLYLCTDAGLFRADTTDGSSRALFKGLSTAQINWADFTADGHMYLATNQGLFQSVFPADPARPRHRSVVTAEEPSIHQVQEAAMRYNSVHPDKIIDWRKRLKYRALFPEVRVDYDNTIRGSSLSGKYYFAEGPYEWGISLSWDMGDLIWNTYEDDIDNRNKLTAQLRMDILDEVTRLYFERLRLKREIASLDDELEETALKELRLMELTAAIDGYTGGCFREILDPMNR